MIAIGILGATGRMGRAIETVASGLGARVAGGLDRDGAVDGEHPDPAKLAHAADVLVDFTAPDALSAHLDAAVVARTPIVIGTTGLRAGDHALIDEAAKTIAVLQSANTALGINLLRTLVEQAARALGEDWDIEIVEMHHRDKLDTPSGTALLLGAAANRGRGEADGFALNRFDRMQEGSHPRERGGIYYASLRGGTVAGEHKVILAGEDERIELAHRADSRLVFARGAVKAALWLAGQPAGRYGMEDMLGGSTA